MNRHAFLALCATLMISATATAAPAAAPRAEGVVRKLDQASGTVTIAHGEIPNLNMGAMTMSFKAKKPAMLKSLKEGDKVRFRAAEVKGELTVLDIDVAK